MSNGDTPDFTSFFLSFASADKALMAAIAQLQAVAENEALAPAVRLQAIGLVQDLGEEERQLVATRDALKTSFTPIAPPSPDVINQAIALNQKLATLVSNELLAEGKLQAVIGVVSALAALTTHPQAAAQTEAATLNLAALRLQVSHSTWLAAMSKK